MVGNGLSVNANQSIWATNTSMRFIFDHPGDCKLSLVREFYANWLTETKYKTVSIRGKDVKFNATILNEFLRTPNCDSDAFITLKDKPPCRDIRHTLCGVESTARWERSKDTGRHNTLYYANFNQVAKGLPINVGAILRQNMMKFRNNLRWRFCYGGLITQFLRARGIKEEVVDLTIIFHPNLTGKLVDMTRTKALDTFHGSVLSAQERQARDDSVMARMFGMAELQLRIGGRPVTDAEMATMAERYPLSESAIFLCKTGPAFLEPLDNDKAIDDEDDDDVVDKETNALMVFDGGKRLIFDATSSKLENVSSLLSKSYSIINILNRPSVCHMASSSKQLYRTFPETLSHVFFISVNTSVSGGAKIFNKGV
ncbi:hypothetical protein H5410_044359 [Solanum commersonii]|uniref:Putative plant transposon protein domain-containing protein n=1 Tax=Solanum commersonii TaxID=4109 RepID=A0A9J5X8U6_SOLCO|nr:hypothetical protein H5410_044359 [Solanum commersonii]